MRLTIGLLLFALLATSCSNSTLQITSKPSKAKVSIYNPQTRSFDVIGQTPLTISDEDQKLQAATRDADVWAVQISKPGYVVEHVMFDHTSNTNFKLNSNLKANAKWADAEDSVIARVADDLGKDLRDIYRSINNSKYQQAMGKVKILIRRYPKAAIFYDIKGSLHLLRGEKQAAISSYKQSLAIDKDRPETLAALKDLGAR